MEVKLELACDRPEDVKRLFTEYTDYMLTMGPEVEQCLSGSALL